MPPAPTVRRSARRPAATAVLGLIFILLLGYELFMNPPLSGPARSDAVVVLAGASDERLPVARDLIESSAAPVLAITRTDTPGNASADRLCRTEVAEVPVVCYSPSQGNSRDEIRALAQVIDEQDWDQVTVVTSRYHATRAYTLLSQCSSADIHMVVSEPGFGVREWLRRFVIEFGGLAQAYWNPSC